MYSVEFSSRPYGFRIVGDDNNKNAIVKAILNPTLVDQIHVGSWVIQVSDIVVEAWTFNEIISVLRDVHLPVLIKFRQSLLLSGTDVQLLKHSFTINLRIEVSDTGKEPSQQQLGKPFVAYNVLVMDGLLKWQIWKRYKQFESLHQQLKRIAPDLNVQLPPKQHFGRFRPGFIQLRRVQLQRYLNSIKLHPSIINSSHFRNFLIPSLKSEHHQSSSSNNNNNSNNNSMFMFNHPSEMKPVLLECRDRLQTLCENIEMKRVNSRENILSSVRYLLSLMHDMCERTRDAVDGTTLSRNFITGLPNNNAFIKCCDRIFYGKTYNNNNNHQQQMYDVNGLIGNDTITTTTTVDDNDDDDVLQWGLILLFVNDYSSIVSKLEYMNDGTLRNSKSDDIAGDLLRNTSQIIYSCILNDDQRVFHIDDDQFAVISPIDG